MRRTAIIFAALFAIGAGPVHAGTVSIGTSFGINHYSPDDNKSFTTFGWPTAERQSDRHWSAQISRILGRSVTGRSLAVAGSG